MYCPMGKDRFSGRFDFFEWSAPFYPTPEDVMNALRSLHLIGKKLKRINVIGIAEGLPDPRTVLMKAKNAGIRIAEPVAEYPDLDQIKVPWQAEACEPLQFVFEDDSTMEILPMEGGARIGTNTIPAAVSDGLNKSDFDWNAFCPEALGRALVSTEVEIRKEERIHYTDFGKSTDTKPYSDHKSTYRYVFGFHDGFSIVLEQTWESWFYIQIENHPHLVSTIPYARIKDAKKDIDQIIIINGRDSGYIWIVPFRSEDPSIDDCPDACGICIDELNIDPYLLVFLNKYRDPSIQDESYGEDYDEFDPYGSNLYTFDQMYSMLDEIDTAADLLENDYDNPILDSLKESWYIPSSAAKPKESMTEAEKNEMRKAYVPKVVDFYHRFSHRMRNLLRIPGCDRISFQGP